MLWELPGGVQAVEFDIGLNAVDAYQFYQDYVGYRVTVTDHFCDAPVAEGWIYGIAISRGGCRVLCRGPWLRHFDQFDDTVYPLADTSTDLIKASLTNFVPIISSDQSNIEETSFALDTSSPAESVSTSASESPSASLSPSASGSESGSASESASASSSGSSEQYWDLSEFGLYPGELIAKMAVMSNSDLNQWNYWVRSAPFAGVLPQAPIAYFEEQVNDGTFNWQINKSDVGGNGFTQERNIEELANKVLVIYRNIDGGTQDLTAWATDSDSQTAFWTKEVVLTGGELIPVGATQYRDLMLSKLKDPLLKRAFTISSRGIRDDMGTRWPLWYPIKNGGGYLRFDNLDAGATLFTESIDRKRVGQIMTAEYDDAAQTLRVSLDTTDDRADALLSQIRTFL